MHSSIKDNICAGNKLIKAKMLLRPNYARVFKRCTKALTTIIVVPLHEILDNIYQLLSHAPTCQSSRAFTPVQNFLHPEVVCY